MRYVCLLALIPSVLPAQDGAAIYKERCASCHDAPAGHTPPISAIKQMSGEAIYASLTSGVMKSRAEGLSTAGVMALIGYIAPTGGAQPASTKPTCQTPAAFHPGGESPQWNGWSPSLTNSRFQDKAAAGLDAVAVPRLKLKWAFNLGDVTIARGQPVVIGGRVFVTSQAGAVYALDAESGCTRWVANPGGAIRAGVAFGDAGGKPAVFFGVGPNVYALNADTGDRIWITKATDHFSAMATATPRYYKGVIYQPYSSFEEAMGPAPNFQCCTFRGSVVALDAATGEKLWQTFTIAGPAQPTHKNSAQKQMYGPSGAGVWSTPTIDEQRGVLYVATGDNYSDPPTDTSDAVLAMDLKTGELLWSKQMTQGDAYNNACGSGGPNCPDSKGPDYDFGQPPILVELGGGKRALVIGQKSGMVHALDPDQKGKLLWQTRVGQGGPLGGSQWGSAADSQRIYVAVSDIGLGGAPDPKSPGGFRIVLDPKKGGGLYALDLQTGKVDWSAKGIPCGPTRTDCSPAQSAAVTAIPGVVFSGAMDGHLRAYSASTGEVLWDFDTEREFTTVNGKPAHGGSIDAAGPAVVSGIVFVNSGYNQFGGAPGNVFLAFSVDGK
ncbi:MAG TPA: PQQ-binding-like beta-propeller repeat protein [Bryobacteraceae bacterium]|nr:PQQ-binding-like beta-propeller repeat protein [Bryobacteraceae bacterium]